ncbi:hypothetical protein LINPERPRIM_LOCUS30708, partial [Linum perenne]
FSLFLEDRLAVVRVVCPRLRQFTSGLFKEINQWYNPRPRSLTSSTCFQGGLV